MLGQERDQPMQHQASDGFPYRPPIARSLASFASASQLHPVWLSVAHDIVWVVAYDLSVVQTLFGEPGCAGRLAFRVCGMIGLQSVLDHHEAGGLDQLEAGELLGISERTFRRAGAVVLEDDGDAGLLDRRPGPAIAQADLHVDGEVEVERLYRTPCKGFNARRFPEHLYAAIILYRWNYPGPSISAAERPAEAGAAAGRASAQTAASSVARNDLHQDGSRHESWRGQCRWT